MLNVGSRIFIIIVVVGQLISPTVGYYPGLRRPPTSIEDQSDLLTQLIEEHARRRFQQQLAQQQFYQHHSHHNNHGQQQQLQQQHGPSPYDDFIDGSETYNGPSFTYSFPENSKTIYSKNLDTDNPTTNDDEIPPFAVGPTDPRFYEGRPSNGNQAINLQKTLAAFAENELNNKNAAATSQLEQAILLNSLQKNHKGDFIADVSQNGDQKDNPYIKQKYIPPKLTLQQPILPKPFRGRKDIEKLVQRLEAEGKENAILNTMQQQQQSQEKLLNGKQKNDELVVRQHMGMDGDMGMYMVALLAGITAAVIVGIMALGVAWITLQKRTKAAADVEYPAYGVTGPNKDISPSGDRRLAQSAQMYHYQHQKQQIIAMENRQNGNEHHSGGLSDVESDDDNEEGDYTVYECPGLAPTGEMEVKNPLFLDDTPITPVATVTTTPPQTASPPVTNKLNNETTSTVNTGESAAAAASEKSTKSPAAATKKKHSQPPPTPQRKSTTNRVNGPNSNENSAGGNKKK